MSASPAIIPGQASLSSPAVNTGQSGSTPAAIAAGLHAPQAPGSTGHNNAAPSPASALLASLMSAGGQSTGLTPAASSPTALFLAHHQQNQLSGQFNPGTPGTPSALLAHARHLGLQHIPQATVDGRQIPGGSVAGSNVTHGAGSSTSAEAPNEARRLVRALLDEQGQGRLSLARIANEVNALMQDVNQAFTTVPAVSPAARLADLLACLDELQLQLAKTGLGALPIGGEDVDYSNVPAMISSLATEVQGNFKHRQRIREGAGVAKSVFK